MLQCKSYSHNARAGKRKLFCSGDKVKVLQVWKASGRLLPCWFLPCGIKLERVRYADLLPNLLNNLKSCRQLRNSYKYPTVRTFFSFARRLPCVDLGLLTPNKNHPKDKYTRDVQFRNGAFGSDKTAIGMCLAGNQHAEVSGKVRVLHELLKGWKAAGDKVLLFSYSIRMLEYVTVHGTFSHQEHIVYCSLSSTRNTTPTAESMVARLRNTASAL